MTTRLQMPDDDDALRFLCGCLARNVDTLIDEFRRRRISLWELATHRALTDDIHYSWEVLRTLERDGLLEPGETLALHTRLLLVLPDENGSISFANWTDESFWPRQPFAWDDTDGDTTPSSAETGDGGVTVVE